jgi:hypothetical protein
VALTCRASDEAADGGGVSRAAFIDSALQDLSATLCKGNAACCVCTFRRSLKPVAMRTCRELPVPVAEMVPVEG